MGRYRLRARLGAGGMGRVYLAATPGGRAVAVKVAHAELAADARFRRRFEVEVAAARRVGGVHTAQVLDADTGADRPWLATEHIAGPTLQRAVEEHGPLPEGAVAALGAGLAEGLAAIHEHVVHRDLKPGNVLLSRSGPRIIDFGIARALDGSSATTRATLLGTPGFIAPEQYLGREAGPACDVFCLAALLVFAATGRRPFGEGPAEALGYRVVNGEPDLGGVPGSLLPLIAAGLEKDPDDRPGVADFLERYSRLAGGAPLVLPEPVTRLITRRVTWARTLVESAEPGRGKAEPRAGSPRVGAAKPGKAKPDKPRPGKAKPAKPKAAAPRPGITPRPVVTPPKPTDDPPAAVLVLGLLGGLLALLAANGKLPEVVDWMTSELRRTPTLAATPLVAPTRFPLLEPAPPVLRTTTPPPDPVDLAFEQVRPGHCLSAHRDPREYGRWSEPSPSIVPCDRTDAYTRVVAVRGSPLDCPSELGASSWTSTGTRASTTLCLERQIRVGECFLGVDGGGDTVSINNKGMMTTWGCDETTVPSAFDHILQVDATTHLPCPRGSLTWDFRGGHLCAHVV